MNKTHGPGMIRETFGNSSYQVHPRREYETLRLQSLARTLDHPSTRLFTVERMLGSKGGKGGVLVRIPVDAMNGAEAGVIADEVKYAIDWQNGLHKTGAMPEPWALNWPDVQRVVK